MLKLSEVQREDMAEHKPPSHMKVNNQFHIGYIRVFIAFSFNNMLFL